MTSIDESLNDAEFLLAYAMRRKVGLPDGVPIAITRARAKQTALHQPGTDRDAFVEAFQALVTTVPQTIADIRVASDRTARLAPMVQEAQTLIAFAAANGKDIGDDVRNGLVESAEAVSKGSPAITDEEKFLQSYQALTTKLAPVTAFTLAASQTRLPSVSEFVRHPWKGLKNSKNQTLGRFFNVAVFVIVLITSGVVLSYQSVGETAITRHNDLDAQIGVLDNEVQQKAAILFDKSTELASAKASEPKGGSDAVNSADHARRLADDDWSLADTRRKTLDFERTSLEKILRDWDARPCIIAGAAWAGWSCNVGTPKDPSNAQKEPTSAQIVFSARASVQRLNQIILPLLLGLLGSFSYVLRTMSQEISESTFAPHSALQQLVRLAIGALAGIASGWLLRPQDVGLLSSVPAWTLAFVAGYGTELIFAFMDRLIKAFTSKST
jgi:hypothetical protein